MVSAICPNCNILLVDELRIVLQPPGHTVGSVDSAPYNQYSLSIYQDVGGAPGTLLAQTANATLRAYAWNSLPISSTLSANTAYGLLYNANGSNASVDNLYYNADPSIVGAYAGHAFGSWPGAFGGSALGGWRFSIFATRT